MKFPTIRLTILEVALLVTFIALKLTKHIEWSWWIVLLPLYARFALVVFCYLGWHAADKLEDRMMTPQQRAHKRFVEKANELSRALRTRR